MRLIQEKTRDEAQIAQLVQPDASIKRNVMDKLKTAVSISDYQLFKDLLFPILRDQGLDLIASFADVEPGLEYVINTPPSLVVIDMMMPFLRKPIGTRAEQAHPYILYDCQMSFEAVRSMSAKCPRTRILMVTGERHPHPFVVGFDAGAHGIASKIDDLSSFLITLKRVMAGESRVTSERMRPILEKYTAAPIPELSPLEVRILELVQEGLESPEIGRRLGYSAKTIRNVLSSINQKLGTSNRFEATEMAIEMGLVGWRTGCDG